MENIKSVQDQLCKWLSTDPDHIIEQCDNILTKRQDKMLQEKGVPVERITLLLQMIIDNGESKCQTFYDILLKEQAHYPDLQQFFNKKESPSQTVLADAGSVASNRQMKGIKANNLKMSVTLNSSPGVPAQHDRTAGQPLAQCCATNNSVACADTVTDVDVGGDIDFSVTVNTLQPAQMVYPAGQPAPKITNSLSALDKKAFFIKNRGALVKDVKSPESIVDDLISKGFNIELAAEVRSETTVQGRMRKILDSAVSSKKLAGVLFDALLEHQNDVIEELLPGYFQ